MVQTVIKYCLLKAIVFITVLGHAQQQPMYTQYMFNGLVLNPAYAGSQETLTATALLRKQWMGIEGAPQTQTFSAHSPLDKLRNKRRPDSKVSLGLTLFKDGIAITDQTGLLASYAYRLKLKNKVILSLGLQAGFSQFRVNIVNSRWMTLPFQKAILLNGSPISALVFIFRLSGFTQESQLPRWCEQT